MNVSRYRHRRLLWAYCPPYRWWRNSALYRKWMLWRWKRSMRRFERIVGRRLRPSLERAAAATVAWQKACEEAGLGKDRVAR